MNNLLQRKAAGKTMEFIFPVRGTAYLVKNLTDVDIYAAIGEASGKSECALIPADTAQVILPMTTDMPAGSTKVTVFTSAAADKEVEIQCLRW